MTEDLIGCCISRGKCKVNVVKVILGVVVGD